MKIKTDNIEFVSFSDGICNIYSKDDDGNRNDNKYTALGFTNRVLGYKKYFAAQANQVQVDKVIRIPEVNIDGYDFVEINGNETYEIKMIQEIYETNPPSIDLTLKEI